MHQFCKFSYLQRMRPIVGALLRWNLKEKQNPEKSHRILNVFFIAGELVRWKITA